MVAISIDGKFQCPNVPGVVPHAESPSPRVAAVALLALAGGGVAFAATAQPAIKTFTPRSAGQVTNIDVLRQQIRNYYGDPLGTGVSPADSNYAKEADSVAAAGERWLDSRHHLHGTKAIVLDVDDTTLLTWNYEIFSNWAFNPTTNASFVTNEQFPAVFGMVNMVKAAEREGYAIIFLTGRPATQEQATLGNLTDSDDVGIDAGLPEADDAQRRRGRPVHQAGRRRLPGLPGGRVCRRPQRVLHDDHYKTATRAHIESLGYDIVANFGDQFSDLKGGYADKTFKMPNPNYFLP